MSNDCPRDEELKRQFREALAGRLSVFLQPDREQHAETAL